MTEGFTLSSLWSILDYHNIDCKKRRKSIKPWGTLGHGLCCNLCFCKLSLSNLFCLREIKREGKFERLEMEVSSVMKLSEEFELTKKLLDILIRDKEKVDKLLLELMLCKHKAFMESERGIVDSVYRLAVALDKNKRELVKKRNKPSSLFQKLKDEVLFIEQCNDVFQRMLKKLRSLTGCRVEFENFENRH